MTSWRDLRAALDEVASRGQPIRLWWRDDDAGRDHPALARLLDLAEQNELPLALAVVPLWLKADAQARIAASGRATVLQHGYAHVDHAPAGSKSVELAGRDLGTVAAELERGRAMLVEALGTEFLAVLVPPWNRIDPELIPHLPGLGFIGISTFGRRVAAQAAPGLVHVNAHLDPIEWRTTRLFVGEAAALGGLVRALDADEPVGLLSHHLVMDEPGWRFFEQLFEVVANHPGVRFCGAGELFETAA